MENLVGKTISRYRIIAKLGQGGMGVVYKAEDISLKRMVALKFLPGNLEENPDRKTRFLREAQTAAVLDHPNIATVYDIFDDGHYAFISMAYVEGVSLKQRIRTEPVDIRSAIQIAIQIASGLVAAHRQGIIHRDIKSANIMLRPDGQVKITDFGLARLKGDYAITQSGFRMGTAAYMSPEQIQGREADQRSDIFSLGVTMYEMLTGKLPFKGEYDQAMMFSILYDAPSPLSDHLPDAPPALGKIVQTMLAKDPAQRYQNADEIVEALKQFQGSEISTASAEATQHVSADNLSLSPEGQGSSTTIIAKQRKGITRNMRMGLLVVLLIVVISAVYYFFPRLKAVPFAERDWILVLDFKNETGEPLFDRSLNTALTVSIGQSRYVNVFPRRRVQQTLQLMKMEPEQTIDEPVAREIALREGIEVLLAPTISRVGDRYALTAVLQNPNTGEIFRSEITYAQNTDGVLEALDRLSGKIRRSLGETVSSISQRSKPLTRVTTSSLEALRMYGVADQLQREAKFAEARSYFERALEIDSTFTAARASLGMLHVEKASEEGFDRQTGIAMIKKAVAHADSLTDNEKYGILAYYAWVVENDLPKAAEYQKALLAIHPDLANVHNNLGIVYRDMGRYDDAIQQFKTAIRLDPSLMVAYNGLNIILLYYAGEIDSARVWAKEEIAMDPEQFWAYSYLAWAYIGLDSLDRAKAALERCLRMQPENILISYRLGHLYRMKNDYQDAADTFLKIAKLSPQEFDAFYQAGLVYRLAGDEQAAQRNFKRFFKENEQQFENNRQSTDYLFNRALYESRMMNFPEAQADAAKALEIDSTLYFQQAQVLAAMGRNDRAIDMLKKAIARGFTNYIWMKIHPDFISLENEPRFKTLVESKLN